LTLLTRTGDKEPRQESKQMRKEKKETKKTKQKQRYALNES